MTTDIFYPPNTIQFDEVFDDFGEKLKDNWIVLATMLACLLAYTIGMIYMNKKDNEDRIMVRIIMMINW